MRAKVLFVDDRLGEIVRLWQLSGCESDYELLPLEPFDSIERTSQRVDTLKPEVVLVGFGLGKPDVTGADVIRALRQGGFSGIIIANSGGGIEQFNQAGTSVDGSVDRNPQKLKSILNSKEYRKVG